MRIEIHDLATAALRQQAGELKNPKRLYQVTWETRGDRAGQVLLHVKPSSGLVYKKRGGDR